MASTVKPQTKAFSSTNAPPGRKELPTTSKNGIKIGLQTKTQGMQDGWMDGWVYDGTHREVTQDDEEDRVRARAWAWAWVEG